MMGISVIYTLWLFMASLKAALAFAPFQVDMGVRQNDGCLVPSGKITRTTFLPTPSPRLRRWSTSESDTPDSPVDQDRIDEAKPDPPINSADVPTSLIPPPRPVVSNTTPRRLDPLVASLTRNDPSPQSPASKVPFPLIGELTLDQSLFVFVPVAAFAVLGLLLSIYVAVNSADDIVQALAENASLQSVPDSAVVSNRLQEGGGSCRGLCNTPTEQDLAGLKAFMQGLAGK